MIKATIQITYKYARRIVITIVGLTVVVIGLLLFFTPGPAIVVIPIGLGILSLEYAWARRWLKLLKDKANSTIDSFKSPRSSNP